jgi:hypothetical protein
MTEEEEAIARRKTAELRASAAGQPPPPPCSADSAAWGGLHTMYTTYVLFILLKMDTYYNLYDTTNLPNEHIVSFLHFS